MTANLLPRSPERLSTLQVVTSEIVAKVTGALGKTVAAQTREQAARVTHLRARIQDLESRGSIRRQEFSAPTTGHFERLMVNRAF
jgi:BMFP domain-containing protein YqiC